jgi:hypothetical protein
MRIVIDMQGAQSTGSWDRGIGIYTMSWVDALIRHRGHHEIFLVLNGAFLKSVERIFHHFKESLSNKNILQCLVHAIQRDIFFHYLLQTNYIIYLK